MRKAFLFLFIISVSPKITVGQTESSKQSQPISGLSIARNVLYNKLIAVKKDGNAIAGLLIGVKNDTLLLLVAGDNKKVTLRNLISVRLDVEKESGKIATAGMILGMYLGTLLVYQAENQPTAFLESTENFELGYWLVNLLGAAVGGGIAYLFDSGVKNEEMFNLSGNEEEQNSEWIRFRSLVNGEYSPGLVSTKVHFSVQTGWVNTLSSNSFENLGYNTRNSNEYGYRVSDFNMMRKLQLTYSYKPELRIGAALMWLGEPSIIGYNSELNSALTHSLHAKGYYVVATCLPLLSQMPQNLVWQLGIGIGVAKVDFKLMQGYLWNHGKEEKLSKSFYSGVIFSELNYMLSSNFSAGLAFDYVIIPDDQIAIQIAEEFMNYNIKLGNSSFGFTFGIHF